MHHAYVLCGVEVQEGDRQNSNVDHRVVANVALWKTMVFSACELFC